MDIPKIPSPNKNVFEYEVRERFIPAICMYEFYMLDLSKKDKNGNPIEHPIMLVSVIHVKRILPEIQKAAAVIATAMGKHMFPEATNVSAYDANTDKKLNFDTMSFDKKLPPPPSMN